MEVTIARRFRGPDESGNGGYSCGAFAGGRDGEVTLRLPPPLETPLQVADGVVRAGDEVVAEVAQAQVSLDPPSPVTWEEAVAARAPDLTSPFPQCFVCGHARGDDALHLHAGPVPGRDLVAAPWEVRADQVGPELVWAALDCPGAFAVNPDFERGFTVLGRLAAHVEEVPRDGEEVRVVAWPLPGGDERRSYAGTCVLRGETPLAWARATWFAVGDEFRDPLPSRG
jgi:hypothetical protein